MNGVSKYARFLKSRFFGRIFVFSLLLASVPVIILGLYAYTKSSQLLVEKTNEVTQRLLMQTELRLEQYLKTVDTTVGQLAASSFFQALLTRPLSERDFRDIHTAIEQIQSVQTFESGIHNIQFYNLHDHWVIGNEGFEQLEEAKERAANQYLELEGRSFWILQQEPGSQPAFLYLVKKLPVTSPQPYGLLIVSITSDEMRKYVPEADEQTEIVILDEHRRLIAESNKRSLGSDLSDLIDDKALAEVSHQPHTVLFQGNESSLTFRQSLYNRWYYVSMTPLTQIRKSTEQIGWFTLAVCASIWAILLLIAWRLSNSVYRPVLALLHSVQTPAGPTSRDWGWDEFAYLKEELQSLRASNTKLASQIQVQVDQMQQLFVRRLLEGGISKREIKEKLQLVPEAARWSKMAVIAVQIDDVKRTRYRLLDKDLLLFAISNMVSELIDVHHRLTPIVLTPYMYAIIGKVEGDSFLEDTGFLTQIKAEVSRVLALEISIGVSRRFEEWSVYKAVVEAREALTYRWYTGASDIFYASMVAPKPGVQAVYPEAIVQGLLDAIRRHEEEKAEERLYQALRMICSREYKPKDYKLLLLRLMLDILALLENTQGGTVSGIAQDQPVHEELLACTTMEETFRWLMDCAVLPVLEALERASTSEWREARLADRLVDLIHQEFDKPLTLEACSRQLHYHSSYLKRVFRRDVGMSFSEYLTQYRMMMAKRWLAETDMLVAEIAKRLQYTNTQNFIRSFRKLEGRTPGVYREMYK